MRNFKKLAVFTIAIVVSHFATAQAIIVTSNNGNTSNIDLSAISSIVFEDNNMVIKKNNYENTYFNVFFSTKITFGESIGVIDDAEPVKNSFTIYPNPASSTLFINTQLNTHSSAKIISANGNILRIANINNQQNAIDISDLPTGLYFIMIDNQSSKFIKQ